MKLGFIGAGEMGGAIIKGLLKSGWPKEEIIASVHSSSSVERLQGEFGICAGTQNRQTVTEADMLFIAVKPGVVPQVLEEIRSSGAAAKPVICMALGWTLEKLQAALPGWPVVRIMPNTPLALGEGVTLFAFGKDISASQRADAQAVFARLGQTVELPEALFDAGTAVSGSGPAFVYYFIDALAKAGVAQGLQPEQAVTLAVQTTVGAAKMVEAEKADPAVLAQKVATPGGCTAAGLDVLKTKGLDEALRDTIGATVDKARAFANK